MILFYELMLCANLKIGNLLVLYYAFHDLIHMIYYVDDVVMFYVEISFIVEFWGFESWTWIDEFMTLGSLICVVCWYNCYKIFVCQFLSIWLFTKSKLELRKCSNGGKLRNNDFGPWKPLRVAVAAHWILYFKNYCVRKLRSVTQFQMQFKALGSRRGSKHFVLQPSYGNVLMVKIGTWKFDQCIVRW